MMFWRKLTSEQLREAVTRIRDDAHDMKPDRADIVENTGVDLYELYRCVARRLEREADRRERKGGVR